MFQSQLLHHDMVSFRQMKTTNNSLNNLNHFFSHFLDILTDRINIALNGIYKMSRNSKHANFKFIQQTLRYDHHKCYGDIDIVDRIESFEKGKERRDEGRRVVKRKMNLNRNQRNNKASFFHI